MRRPEFPIWSAISILCVLIPAPLHWRSRNVATVSVIVWLTLYNAVNFVNSLIWADNYKDSAPIWSDISSRITAIFLFAIPLCSLCQMRQLADIMNPKSSLLTDTDHAHRRRIRKRRVIEEMIVCNLLPLLMIPVLYCIQGHRYDIMENVGPIFPSVVSWMSVLIQRLLPCLISFVSLGYGWVALRRFSRMRDSIKAIDFHGSKLTSNVYYRLLGSVTCNCVAVMFLSLWYFVNRAFMWQTNGVLVFSLGWEETHAAFDLIYQYPESSLTGQDMEFSNLVPFWVGVLYGILFFVFWGCGEDAIVNYRLMWRRISRTIKRKSSTEDEKPNPQVTLGSTAITLSGMRRKDEPSRFGHGDRPHSYDSLDFKSDPSVKVAPAPSTTDILVQVETSIQVETTKNGRYEF